MAKSMKKSTGPALKLARSDAELYTLDVFLDDGPITFEFAGANEVVSRVIQIRGDQTLDQLHDIIFRAFDRFDPHLYEFQVGGKGPDDPKARRFVAPLPELMQCDDRFRTEDATATTIDSLSLRVGQIFGYWFDFGDDWRHFIVVNAIDKLPAKGCFPKIVKRTGDSPPQYPDYDELFGEEGSDDEPAWREDDPVAELVDLSMETDQRRHEIQGLTDRFCDEHLDDEYRRLSRELVDAISARGLPITRGKAESWAAGVVYMLGRVNFLSDPDSEPYMIGDDLAKGFGISTATMQSKARIIREELNLVPLDPSWTLPSRYDENPMIWMFSVDGIIVDIRDAPRDAQVEAYEQGLIPYIPADQ